ncbi:MAG: DUF2179 domain-containing protein [Oscillospiraceae bacterium]
MIFREAAEISKLLKQKRGVTLLHGEEYYSGEEKLVVCIAVHKNEYVKVKRIVKDRSGRFCNYNRRERSPGKGLPEAGSKLIKQGE